MWATAEWLLQGFNASGFESTLWETENHPCVFASHCKAGPDAPTLLFYNHYDVQPVDPLELWESDPFVPVIKDGVVYARGASDNKGQCFYTFCALRAFLELSKDIPINIKAFIEGEEEVGSVGTEGILHKRAEELQADYLFIVDGGLLEPNVPAIGLGLRGLLCLQVDVVNSSIDLHSGIHGGVAFNPNHALIQALSTLWDASGKIAVPHFYDGIQELSDEERAMLTSKSDKKKYERDFGIKYFVEEPGYHLGETSTIRPTLDINGISGGYAGEGFKTVIPAKASAKLSCRLVAGQDPHTIATEIQSWILKQLPKGLDAKVEILQEAPAFQTSFDTTVVKIAKTAYEEVFRKPCGLFLCGATVPIVTGLAKASNAETVIIGMGLDSDDIHAPNEHFDLSRFETGYMTIARILTGCSSFT